MQIRQTKAHMRATYNPIIQEDMWPQSRHSLKFYVQITALNQTLKKNQIHKGKLVLLSEFYR